MGKLSIRIKLKKYYKFVKRKCLLTMKNLSKQVLILDNFSSPYIYQAIIILKSFPEDKHEKIISEAEKIVSSYFEKNQKNNSLVKQKANNQKPLTATVILLSLALTISLAVTFFK